MFARLVCHNRGRCNSDYSWQLFNSCLFTDSGNHFLSRLLETRYQPSLQIIDQADRPYLNIDPFHWWLQPVWILIAELPIEKLAVASLTTCLVQVQTCLFKSTSRQRWGYIFPEHTPLIFLVSSAPPLTIIVAWVPNLLTPQLSFRHYTHSCCSLRFNAGGDHLFSFSFLPVERSGQSKSCT